MLEKSIISIVVNLNIRSIFVSNEVITDINYDDNLIEFPRDINYGDILIELFSNSDVTFHKLPSNWDHFVNNQSYLLFMEKSKPSTLIDKCSYQIRSVTIGTLSLNQLKIFFHFKDISKNSHVFTLFNLKLRSAFFMLKLIKTSLKKRDFFYERNDKYNNTYFG